MKTILCMAVIAAAISGCGAQREVQAEMVNAQVIKIDTVFRYTSAPQRILTWRDDYDVEYVTYASLNSTYAIGSRMKVLVKR